MTMLLPKLGMLLSALVLTSARDTSKFMKTVPTISNSLVNLGKMEISFHFNGKHPDYYQPMPENNINTDFYSSPAEETCPCTNFKSPTFLSDPANIVNKILKSNDLFKDPTSSTCCESMEHMQEKTVIFELNPNNLPNLRTSKNTNDAPKYPNFLRAPAYPNFIPLSNGASAKPRTVEIFMFPKKNSAFDFANFLKPKKTKDATAVKSDLQVIRDGGMMQPPTSVKKDLTGTEKKSNIEPVDTPKEELQTDGPSVTHTSNTL